MRTSLRLLLIGALLASATACFKNGPDEALGDLKVTTHLASGTPDANGYMVSVTGHGSKAIGVTDSVTFTSLPIGNYTVALTDVAAGCVVTDGASQSVYVPVGVKTFDFTVTCP